MTLRDFARFWGALILWMLFIFSASTDALSAEHTSRFLGPFLRWLKPDISATAIETIHVLIRKGSHVTEYAIFAALLWRAIHYGTKIRASFRLEAVIVFFLAVFYAAGDEFHQSFVQSRGSSAGDVMIDSGGILLGIFVSWAIIRKRRIAASHSR
ncbi:MAG: VanZ family protein [Verrucomicrobiota bacterium]